MLPIDFPQRNRILTGQKDDQGNPLDEIIDLPSYTNEQVCVSHWQLTDEEKQQLAESGGIWVWLIYPAMLPIRISSLCPINWPNLSECAIRVNTLHESPTELLTFWELSGEEIELIQATGRFWFIIQSGNTQPPIWFQINSPFENHENTQTAEA